MAVTSSPERRKIAGKIAAITRHNPDADVSDLRADLAALSIEDYIKAIVANAPPLSDSARDRLAALLRGGQHA